MPGVVAVSLRVRSGILSLIGLGVAISLALAAGAGRADGSRSCGPASARTFAENSYVRVYQTRDGEYRPFWACSKRSGKTYPLDQPSADNTAFPVFGISRWYVAWAENTTDPENVYTTVGVVDSRRFGEGETEPIVNGAAVGQPAKVGAVVVNSKGSVAWTRCPSNATFASLAGCNKPGRDASVWRSAITTRRVQLLDAGRGIDPSSLRVKGFRIRWLNDGLRKKAKLE
jgi:hypothetical protein